MASKNNIPFDKPIKALLAFALAWLVPGAGHAFVGRPWRGLIIFLAIGATFWGGVAMGGVMTVDQKEQKWWFAAEMLTGVAAEHLKTGMLQMAQAKAGDALISARTIPGVLVVIVVYLSQDPMVRESLLALPVQLILGLTIASMAAGYWIMRSMVMEAS